LEGILKKYIKTNPFPVSAPTMLVRQVLLGLLQFHLP